MRNNATDRKRSAPSARLEDAAIELIKTALGSWATVRRTTRDAEADLEIVLHGGHRIFVQMKSRQPSVGDEDTAFAVQVLHRATRRLHEDLRRRGESFVDLDGTVYLAFPNLLVDRERLPKPIRVSARRTLIDPFADRSSLVLRTLLESDKERVWGVRELAEQAGVAPATVSRVTRELQRFQVVDVRRIGRESRILLTDSRALLDRWVQSYDWTKNQRIAVHAPMGDPTRFFRRNKDLFDRHRWALTLQAGASLVAPHATWERVHVYIDVQAGEELVELAEQQGWAAAEDGKLVLMKPYYKDSVWRGVREVDGLPVVSSLQLVLDLWHYPLRGREQAEHIIETMRLLQ